MALKSVIDIDLDDSKFQRFKELFDRYTQTLQKQPELWKKIGGIHAEHAENFAEMAGTIGKISAMQRQMTETDRVQEKHLGLSQKLWTSISRSSKETFGNIENATRSLSKWAGILGGVSLGLLGVGSIFGFDRLAGSIGGQRRSAGGVGMSIGEQQAFTQHFGRFVNPDAFTGWVAGMQQDITQQVPARALLHRPLTGTSQDMLDMLDAVRNLARSSRFKGARGLAFLGPTLQSMGLNLPQEDVRRLRDSDDAEYGRERGTYAADAARLNIPDKAAEKYQNFLQQMDAVAQQMRAKLGPALLGLVSPLTHLSSAFADALSAFLKAPVVKNAIESLAGGLEEFAKYLGSEDFKASAKSFAEDMSTLAGVLKGITNPTQYFNDKEDQFKDWFGGKVGATGADIGKGVLSILSDPFGLGGASGYVNRAGIMDAADRQYGLKPGMVELIRHLEHSGDSAVSKAGAVGAFQFMPDTARAYGVNPLDFKSSAYGTGHMLSDLIRQFHGDTMSVLASVNYGSGRVSSLKDTYGSDWPQMLPTETKNYVRSGMSILLMNQTGGDVNLALASLGAAP